MVYYAKCVNGNVVGTIRHLGCCDIPQNNFLLSFIMADAEQVASDFHRIEGRACTL